MSRAAVMLFFITSGYVIGLTNCRPFSGTRAWEYLRRRALRIMPIYIIAILGAWVAAYRFTSVWNVLENLLFLQNQAWNIDPMPGDLPLWSLHYEAVYYLGFLLVWAFRPKVLPVFLVSLALAVGDWFYGGPLSFLGGWSAGALFWLGGLLLAWNPSPRDSKCASSILSLVLLAYATNHLWPGVVLLRGMGFPYAGSCAIGFSDLVLLPVTIMVFCAVMNLGFPGQRIIWWLSVAIPVGTAALLQGMGRLWENAPWTMAGSAIIAAVALIPFNQEKWGGLFFRLFRPLGKISYGLYLFHVPCVVLVSVLYPWTSGWPNYIGGFLSWIAATILVSWVCEAKLQAAILSVYKGRRPLAAAPQ